MCSDDPGWVRANWPSELQDRTVFVTGTSSREVDMAVLTLCDHTVISAGSFGWWAAYLRGSAGNFRSPLSSVVQKPPTQQPRGASAADVAQSANEAEAARKASARAAVCMNRPAPRAIADLIRAEENSIRSGLALAPACISKLLSDMSLKRRLASTRTYTDTRKCEYVIYEYIYVR